MQYLTHYDSPLGPITLGSDGTALTALWFDGQKYDRDIMEDDALWKDDIPVFDETRKWLDIYFTGKDPGFTPPLKMGRSEFYKYVGQAMLEIPFGETTTYGAIAAKVAKWMGREHMSAQAVGGAVGHNSISVIIPCHRVVGATGSLTGYAGGIDKKIKLLTLEGVDTSGFFVPKKSTAP